MSMPVISRKFPEEDYGASPFRSAGQPRPQPRSAYLVALNALRVTCGVSYGDQLQSAADLFVGDLFRTTRPSEAIPVLVEEIDSGTRRVHFERADIGSKRKTLRHVEDLTLMSEQGETRIASVIRDAASAHADHFLLLEAPLTARTEYQIVLKA